MESDVTLTFDVVLDDVLDAADVAWRQLHVSDASVHVDADPNESDTNKILRHGKTWKHIHGYFSNLEFRKCFLSLRAKPNQLNNFKLLSSDTSDAESMGRSHKGIPMVDRLSDKEFAVYGQALLCAQFPRLCVSTPWSGASSELYSYANEARTNYSASATESISLTSDPEDAAASVIPTETLCEILRLAFGVSRELAAQYERMVYEQYKRKTREKILVEELLSQLSLLENNKHPFYNSSTFLSKGAYEQWQQLQRQHIMALINKIWHFTLPPLKGSIHYDPEQFHGNYKILMEKMVRFENSSRSEESGPIILSPLSTATLRLLKEYGLRYGVGEQYRRLVYLEHLADHFENELWYIQHLHSVLEGLLDGLPSAFSRAVMVQQEHEIFVHTSHVLQRQCENSLTRIRRLFTSPNVNAAQGVACLLDLLRLSVRLKIFLQEKSDEPIETTVTRYTQKNLTVSYERQKLIAVTDLQLSALEDYMTPKLIGRMVIAVRDEFREYKDVFSAVYIRYVNVVELTAKTLYKLLMDDVRLLCAAISSSRQKEDEILPLLAVVYKLYQLDNEWKEYISLGDQVWRTCFIPESVHWMELLRSHSRQFVMQAVCADKFEPVRLPKEKKSTKDSAGGTQRAISTGTTKSLSQSEHSAFTPVKTSQQKKPTVASTSRSVGVTASLNKKHPDKAQSPAVKTTKAFKQKDSETTKKSGVYIPKSLSSPELVSLKNYAESIHTLRPELAKSSDELSATGNEDTWGASTKLSSLTASTSRLRSLPESLNNDSNNNLMASGNFSFMRQANKASQHEQISGPLNVLPSSHNQLPAKNDFRPHVPLPSKNRNLPRHIEVIAVKQTFKSSQNRTDDRFQEAATSDSETDYEVVESDYTDSSADDDDDATKAEKGPEAFPRLTAIETSWNGSLGSLRVEDYMENYNNGAHEQNEVEDPHLNNLDDETHQKRTGAESPNNAFSKIMRMTSHMLEAHALQEEERTRMRGAGRNAQAQRTRTPTSSRSTPTVHWDARTNQAEGEERKLLVSGSLIDVSCLIHRLISFVQTLCQSLCALPDVDRSATTEADVEMLRALIQGRKDLLRSLLQTLWLLVTGYSNNLLAFDLCGEVERKARLLVSGGLVDEVKNEFKAGYIWGCRHQQASSQCNEFINKKTAYLADRFEPISEEMCVRLNDVWSLHGALVRFEEKSRRAVDVDLVRAVEHRLQQADMSDLLNDYQVCDVCDIEVAEHTSDPTSCESPKDDGLTNHVRGVVFQQGREQLDLTVDGLANLLAYRMNLFFTEALHVLLAVSIPGVSLVRRLVPATDFLRNHLLTLRHTLYRACYRRVVQRLWQLVVRDFEVEMADLDQIRGHTGSAAKLLLEAITCFLRFFNNHVPDSDVDLFAQQAAPVCEQLQLHTLSTDHLIRLHQTLQDMVQSSLSETGTDDICFKKEYLEEMRMHLHSERKTFSGTALMQFLTNNILKFASEDAHHFAANDPIESVAEKIAQRLLDSGIILSMEDSAQKSHPSDSVESSVREASPYPTVGVYSSPSCSASFHRSETFSQLFRKASIAMTEQCIPSEDEEPLSFGSPASSVHHGNNAKKERKRAHLKKESSNRVLSESDGASFAPEMSAGEAGPVSWTERSRANSTDLLDVSNTPTRATTASSLVMSHSSYTSGGHFMNSPSRFYRFAGQLDDLLVESDSTTQDGDGEGIAGRDGQRGAAKNGAWCRGRTVTREFILSIINARKSVDLQARCYLQNLPDHILLTANSIAQQSPVVGCFGMFFS